MKQSENENKGIRRYPNTKPDNIIYKYIFALPEEKSFFFCSSIVKKLLNFIVPRITETLKNDLIVNNSSSNINTT